MAWNKVEGSWVILCPLALSSRGFATDENQTCLDFGGSTAKHVKMCKETLNSPRSKNHTGIYRHNIISGHVNYCRNTNQPIRARVK